MSNMIGFHSLADAYYALLLHNINVDTKLVVYRNSPLLQSDIIMSRFVDDSVFMGKKNLSLVNYSALTVAANNLCSVAPNLVYSERLFAVMSNNPIRDFSNHFRSEAFRDIFKPDTETIFNKGWILRDDKTLKRAPSFRINYSRLVRTLLKSLAGSIMFVDSEAELPECTVGQSVDAKKDKYTIYKFSGATMPLNVGSLYLPCGLSIYGRCGVMYIMCKSDLNIQETLSENFSAMTLPNISESFDIELSIADMPLSAWVLAKSELMRRMTERGFKLPKNWEFPAFSCCDFGLGPNIPDVMCYVDLQYDLVKRLGVDVDIFKTAAYDFGTGIERIVDDTYDLFPQYHNGTLAFVAAVKRYESEEMSILLQK